MGSTIIIGIIKKRDKGRREKKRKGKQKAKGSTMPDQNIPRAS